MQEKESPIPTGDATVLEIARSLNNRIARNTDTTHYNRLPGRTCHPDIHLVSAVPAAVLEKVVVLARSSLPGRTTIC